MGPAGGVPLMDLASYLLLPLLVALCALAVALAVTERRRAVLIASLLGASALTLTSAALAAGVIDLGGSNTDLAQGVSDRPSTRPLPHAAAGAGDPPVLEVVLGEWDVAASAGVVAPGPLLIHFTNAGSLPHALRIRSEDPGPRIEFRADPIHPGGSGSLTVHLPDGRYTLDCPIEDGHGEHDALGMEIPLEVREGAALPTSKPEVPAGSEDPDMPSTVTIETFAFLPDEVRVQAGDEVTWTNRDRAPHTATGESWGTEALAQGDTESIVFARPGRYPYLCAIHPSMTGTVVVEP